MCGKSGSGRQVHLKAWQEVKGYSSAARTSTAMILGLPALVLLVGPASDNSQRSIKSSAEILGETSAFSSPSASGSRDCREKESQYGGQGGEGEKRKIIWIMLQKRVKDEGWKLRQVSNQKSLTMSPGSQQIAPSANDTTNLPLLKYNKNDLPEFLCFSI